MAKAKKGSNLKRQVMLVSMTPFTPQAEELVKLFKARERAAGGWLDVEDVLRFVAMANAAAEKALAKGADRIRLGEECADFWDYFFDKYGSQEMDEAMEDRWPDQPLIMILSDEYYDSVYALSPNMEKCMEVLCDYIMSLLEEGKIIQMMSTVLFDSVLLNPESDIKDSTEHVSLERPEDDDERETIREYLEFRYRTLIHNGGLLRLLILDSDAKTAVETDFLFLEQTIIRLPEDAFNQFWLSANEKYETKKDNTVIFDDVEIPVTYQIAPIDLS